MSRKHKKRNKAYSGVDAATSKPNVTRIKAAERTRFGEWWFDNKKRLRIIGLIGGLGLIFGYIIYELARLVF